MSLKDRHAKERQFFATSPWDALRGDRVGIPALSGFLAQLLYEHIRREFPAVVAEIEQHCQSLQAEVEKLGPPRQSTTEQRQYLTQISSRYQKKKADYLRGVYGDDLSPDDPLKLRMHIRDLNDAFAKRMSTKGHTRAFRRTDDKMDPEYHLGTTETSTIYDWIRTSYLESRGCELPGCVNPAVIENLFRQQTANWQDIAKEHLAKVNSAVNEFLTAIFGQLVIDPTVQYQLRNHLLPMLEDSNMQAHRTLEDTLEDERGGILQTVNHYFAENLTKAREDRVLSRLRKMGFHEGHAMPVNLPELTKALRLGNDEQTVYDIHDILKAYYKVAIKRFNDEVVTGVVERSWLGQHGFVDIFDPEFVGALSDEEVASIAAENFSTTNTRSELREKLRRFEEARRIAKSI